MPACGAFSRAVGWLTLVTVQSVVMLRGHTSAATSEHLQASPLLVMVPLEQEHFAIKASCNHPALIQEANDLQAVSRSDACPWVVPDLKGTNGLQQTARWETAQD